MRLPPKIILWSCLERSCPAVASNDLFLLVYSKYNIVQLPQKICAIARKDCVLVLPEIWCPAVVSKDYVLLLFRKIMLSSYLKRSHPSVATKKIKSAVASKYHVLLMPQKITSWYCLARWCPILLPQKITSCCCLARCCPIVAFVRKI